MKNYARVVGGYVAEVIFGAAYEQPSEAIREQVSAEVWESLVARAGSEIPIDQRFTPEFVASLIEIPSGPTIPQEGWSAAIESGAWVFNPPVVSSGTTEELAVAARYERDRLLNALYDPGIMMALRALRMAATPEQIDYAEGKVSELDSYAESLLAIPDQVGFPQTIIWPVAPTK